MVGGQCRRRVDLAFAGATTLKVDIVNWTQRFIFRSSSLTRHAHSPSYKNPTSPLPHTQTSPFPPRPKSHSQISENSENVSIPHRLRSLPPPHPPPMFPLSSTTQRLPRRRHPPRASHRWTPPSTGETLRRSSMWDGAEQQVPGTS